MSDQSLMLLLQSMDKKIDSLTDDVSSLKETRAEARGVGTIIKILGPASVISGIVSWFTAGVHH